MPSADLMAPPFSLYLKSYRREVQPLGRTLPPRALGLLLAGGKRVTVELRTDELRRRLREGIFFQQCRPGRLVLQQILEKARKPSQTPRVIERSEPHLPVQPRLMWDVPGWAARHIARLVAKRVFAPLDAVARTLGHDFLPPSRHDRDQAITTHHAQRLDQSIDFAGHAPRAAAETHVPLNQTAKHQQQAPPA